MASSLINNGIQVYFDSVIGMEHEGMVAMFEALLASGLSGFLGCYSAIYEAALVEFFHNASARDGKVVSTVQGKPIAISKELFAGTFELPLEGLTDIHDVPKDLVLEARSAFSYDGKHLSTSSKKREMTFEFRLLNDILAKSVTVKAGSFDAVTHERFLMMSAIHGGIPINWGKLLFNIFKDMVTHASRQARGYAVQICILLKMPQIWNWENFNTLTSQLSELVDYINRGGSAKRGKVVAAAVRSLLLMIVADLVLVMKEADLAEVVGVNLRVKGITKVVDPTEDQEEALDTG
ncbi:hypothetical protein F511_22416 [Dorcoceras hygrometricum]|uniref:Dystroglycan-like n=1 Tax=Dorcoceras hygrometricum TaxID=472368 RepID=A0A2Z7BNZ9_9LAMI|nr:hypothetical protein F511_22416 [Dorcoceras hygrometricum]